MIARIWHGAVQEAKADAYHDYLLRTGIPDYLRAAGNRGVYVLRRSGEGQARFLLISLWDSLAAVRGFAGDDLDKARYYPEDEAFLLELQPHVLHYDALDYALEPLKAV
jgi:heme-degrading monooxygenase HmoA